MIGTWATVSGDWASQTQTWIGTAMSPDAAIVAGNAYNA